MLLRPFYLPCLAHASYLLADETTKTAIVVDPQRDVDEYIATAKEFGVTIRHVMLTHFHADFASGHLELRDLCGAQIHLGAKAHAEYAFSPLHDGQKMEWGSLGLRVLETPGHTPESVTLLVYDLTHNADKPLAALTGDTLFIGDVGRPDLMASQGVAAEDLAGMLYDSLTQKILKLPDETLIYPAHGAGSLCGKKLSDERCSTLGQQRLYNYALKAQSRAEFIALVTADQPQTPAYFAHDARFNQKEHATLEKNRESSQKGLAVDSVEKMAAKGATILDVRDPSDYSGAHWKGSINIGLDGKFANWAGSLLDHARPIVIIADAGREREAVTRLARIGYDAIAGFLDGGMAALSQHPNLIAETPRTTARHLSQWLQSKEAPITIDVRTKTEREAGLIPGSLHVPLDQWPQQINSVPRDKAVAVYCAGGYRSSIAASLLRAAGYTNVTDVIGGFAAWQES
jgi:glyoxylase-like metal-dependent hydrolase (beta-lactamase superfamily II)/rhodanese-related sulfurtransferase